MMKRYFLFFCMTLSVLGVRGQGTVDYYRLPNHDRAQSYQRVLTRYGGASIIDRWYASLEGFVRTDRAQLDESFSGLIDSKRVTKFGAGAVIGWVYRERWAVEAGYARMPIHTQLSVNSSYVEQSYQSANDRQGFVLRGKRQILSTSGPWRRSGFWLSTGLWLVPNSGRQEGQFKVSGQTYRTRREWSDSFVLSGQTRINAQPTGLLEIGAEYGVRVTDNVDLGLSVRKYWGLGNSLTTDLTYSSLNRGISQSAQLNGKGTGMAYGLTLRYAYSIRRHQPRVLDLRGNRTGSRLGR